MTGYNTPMDEHDPWFEPQPADLVAARLAGVHFAAGAVAGAALALLAAPASGRDARAWIGGRATSARQWTADQVRQRRERVHRAIERRGVLGLVRRPDQPV